MTRFQIILTAIFGFFIVVGVLVFSAYKGSGAQAATVVVWGTIPQSEFSQILQQTTLLNNDAYHVQYVEKSADTFDAAFIEALASGNGPDLFMLPSDRIVKHFNKILEIPYDVFSERQFKDAFIEGAEIYLSPNGVVGFPVSVNPLVMYWNRQIFTDAKLTAPPKYWDEFFDLAKKISKKDGSLNVSKSAVSFGEFANIAHAKDIILNLTMQAGSPITVWNNGTIWSVFSASFDKPTAPSEAAVTFYTEFGNPAKEAYSWNRSLPNSTNYFLSGDLALYFGLASEAPILQLKNPNLNFDVAPVPTSREGKENVSFASFNAFAVTKASKNPQAAFMVASILSDTDGATAVASVLGLPPARRDLLGKKPKNAYQSVFYDSAIRSRSWLDPSPERSTFIFKTMIESITSGRSRVSEAISQADRELQNLFSK